MKLPHYSLGVGDRFAQQGRAQLAALVEARRLGAQIAPVWNKSNREHLIVHSAPPSTRAEADAAVRALLWKQPYFVDADHIGLKTVDPFLECSDFFTIDVADFIGKPGPEVILQGFLEKKARDTDRLEVPGIERPLEVSPERIKSIALKYRVAVQEAGRIYRHIAAAKGPDSFVTEVSMDETDQPQTPLELLVILSLLAVERVPLQTIAPKFTGRFNKGVDYVGDVAQFEREFNDDLAVIAYAVGEFGLPENLKLSVHSGSDKFSIYGPIHRALKADRRGTSHQDGGHHLAGRADRPGLRRRRGAGDCPPGVSRGAGAVRRVVRPYAAVIDIDRRKLPPADEVDRWPGEQLAAALRHDPRLRCI